MEAKRNLNELFKMVMGGIPSHHLPQPQYFHVSSRTVVIVKIPYGTGPKEILWELLSRVKPIGNIEKMQMFGPTCCKVRYNLPKEARRAITQINRMLAYDLQLYHLAPIFICLESEAKESIRSLNERNYHQNVADSPRTLCVRNFGNTTTRYVLEDIFSRFGELSKIPDIIILPNGDKMGFIVYLNLQDRETAMIRAQGLQLPDGTHLWICPHKVGPMKFEALPEGIL